MCYDAGIPVKTLQKWMGHSDATMIMRIYAKLTNEREPLDITAINNFTKERFKLWFTINFHFDYLSALRFLQEAEHFVDL